MKHFVVITPTRTEFYPNEELALKRSLWFKNPVIIYEITEDYIKCIQIFLEGLPKVNKLEDIEELNSKAREVYKEIYNIEYLEYTELGGIK